MKQLCLIVLCAGSLLTPASADVMTSLLSATAAFSNPDAPRIDVWQDPSYWSVAFTAATFSGPLTQSLKFGTITLTNWGAVTGREHGNFAADLNLTIDLPFTAQPLLFTQPLALNALPGNGNGNTLNLLFSAPPSPRTFTVGNQVFTVVFDGFFAPGSTPQNPVATLFVSNRNPSGSASADLWGSVSSTALASTAVSSVAEPTAILLLGSVILLTALVCSRRRRTPRQDVAASQ
jgi:hypothetical protein